MLTILASNHKDISIGKSCEISKTFLGKPSQLMIENGMFAKNERFDFNFIVVEILDEEKSKSFLGSAGIGLVGGVLLGPVGLIAGALVGGNNAAGVFGLSFKFKNDEIKIIVKTTSKDEIALLKKKAFEGMLT